MENKSIFGSEIELPTLPGLKSDCEKELTLLMKEIDLEFENRHKDLRTELSKLRSLCQAQQNELENAKSILLSHQQDSYHGVIANEKILKEDIEELKKENSALKRENEILRRKSENALKNEMELENLKINFRKKEEDNSVLKIRLNKLDEKHKALQSNYQKLVDVISSQQGHKAEENSKGKTPSSLGSIDTLIASETEKYQKEEAQLRDRLHSKINQRIEDLERRLNEEIG